MGDSPHGLFQGRWPQKALSGLGLWSSSQGVCVPFPQSFTIVSWLSADFKYEDQDLAVSLLPDFTRKDVKLDHFPPFSPSWN